MGLPLESAIFLCVGAKFSLFIRGLGLSEPRFGFFECAFHAPASNLKT